MLSLGLVRAIERTFNDKGGFASQYLPIIFCGLFALGVYGRINQKPMFKLWFWKSYYYFSIILSISLLAFALYLALVSKGGVPLWAEALVLVTLFIIPAQFKLKEYCFKTTHLWRSLIK